MSAGTKMTNIPKTLQVNGRFYTRGCFICLDELGQTYVVRLKPHENERNTHYASRRTELPLLAGQKRRSQVTGTSTGRCATDK